MSKEKSDMTAVEAARVLGVGLDYLYGLIWTGKIAATKVRNRWRVPVQSVDARLRALKAKNG
jgi:excisionase family DNA binding protein